MRPNIALIVVLAAACTAPHQKPHNEAQSSGWTCRRLEQVSLKSPLPANGPTHQLWHLIEHSKDVSCKQRAAFTIGLIGGATDIDPLQAFIVDQHGEVPIWVESLRCNGIDALGLLALRASGQPAARPIVEYLIESTDPQQWSARGVDWHVGPYGTAAQTHDALAKCAISALPSTQSPVALAHLRSLAAHSADPHVISLSHAAIEQYSKIGPGPHAGALPWR